ncbi:MAG TPA: diguanylate cyclase [Terriglobales bacterium]|nr:diguanylate cyclase [Terriglobales bacterium]
MQRLAILYDASQAVLSTFDLDEVLSHILGIVRDVFHLDKGAILLLDARTQELYLKTQFGWDPGIETIRVPLGRGLTGTAAQTKKLVYAPDVGQDPRYIRPLATTRSEVAIPLMVREEVAGVLDCQSDQLDFFDQETLELLRLFSTQASIALANARLYSLEQRRRAQLEAINAIAKQTTAVLEIGELLKQVCSLILESFGGDHASVLLFEDDRLVLRAHQGRLTPLFKIGDELPAGEGLFARAIDSRKAVVENDVGQVPGYLPGFRETVSAVCLPLVSFGQVLGVLVLESASRDAFAPADVNALESVTDICATAIQNARYFDRVRQLAYLDGVTGIFNRRYFELRIAEEIARSSRHGLTFSVIMVDIDHFKQLNDEFGHLLGDEVLRQVSAILSQQLRKSDVLSRYGGEEFAIITPETGLESALAVSDKLRRVVESWHFPGVARPVTISAGVAEYPVQGGTRDQLVKSADEALYAAKQSGRNRVVTAQMLRRSF